MDAALLFDSAREPLLMGVRTGSPSARLLIYAKGGRLLKLRVESPEDSQILSLAGQLVEEGAPHRMLQDVPVLVQDGRKTVNQTQTNLSGEFTLDLSMAQELRLVIGLPGREAIMVMLPIAAAIESES